MVEDERFSYVLNAGRLSWRAGRGPAAALQSNPPNQRDPPHRPRNRWQPLLLPQEQAPPLDDGMALGRALRAAMYSGMMLLLAANSVDECVPNDIVETAGLICGKRQVCIAFMRYAN